MSSSLIEIGSADDFANSIGSKSNAAVLLFGADWHEACPTLKAVLIALSQSYTDGTIIFGNVDAEHVSELSDRYGVTMVPTVIFLLNQCATVWKRLEGEQLGDPAELTLAVQGLIQASSGDLDDGNIATEPPVSQTKEIDPKQALNDRLERLINDDTVMLFMKGNPTTPRCGFSRQAVEILNENEVPFGSFDILSDEDVRQGLKGYSDWPTYPQIYVRGELIGGLDILKETAAGGALKEELEIGEISSAANNESLHDRLASLIKRHDVMLFMKGLPSAPQCGFSRQIVDLLDQMNVSYDAFNILEDEEIRAGLKEFSDWPTYPQLYVLGELVGGLDIVSQMHESGELKELLEVGGSSSANAST